MKQLDKVDRCAESVSVQMNTLSEALQRQKKEVSYTQACLDWLKEAFDTRYKSAAKFNRFFIFFFA